MMDQMILAELEEMKEMSEEIGTEGANERFKIKDLGGANWAFRKLKAIELKEREIKDFAEQEIERIKKWEKEEIEFNATSKGFFEGLLTEYYVTQREADDKFRLTTPNGSVTSRKQQLGWTYDEDKALESLKKANINRFTKEVTKKSLVKADLKKEVEILENVCSLNGEVKLGVRRLPESGFFIDNETGEIFDTVQHDFHPQAIVYNGKIIEGVTVTERPDTISIKVEI